MIGANLENTALFGIKLINFIRFEKRVKDFYLPKRLNIKLFDQIYGK